MPRKPPEGRRFKPGQSGNPKGPGVVPKELREAKKLTKELFQGALNKLTTMSRAELSKYIGSARDKIPPHPDCTVLELMIAGQIDAAMKGKPASMTVLLDRSTYGPVSRKIIIEDNPFEELEHMTESEKEALRAKIRRRRQGN